jgi:hypothetical protein
MKAADPREMASQQQPLPPLDCVRDGICRRLASAPGDGTTWHFAEWVMEYVSRGLVRRVQMQPQRRAYCAERVWDVTDQYGVAAAEEL